MGLFILPGRLLKETAIVEEYLTGAKVLPVASDSAEAKHSTMIEKLVASHGTNNSSDAAKEIVTEEINNVCKNILGNISVFKDSESFAKFAEYLGLVL